MTAQTHYDASYFAWQRAAGGGEFGGWFNRFKYQPHIQPTDRVLDFGCGGGFLLAGIACAERRGIELNPSARAQAMQNGLVCTDSPDAVPDEWADVIMSNSCLEHVEHPLLDLRRLFPKVRRGGLMVFTVPNETLASRYRTDDINQHLYCWSPATIGNLFAHTGFIVKSITINPYLWPPGRAVLARLLGAQLFRVVCHAYRNVRMALWPLRPLDIHADITIVAQRP